jgi:hypothetical protein
MKSYTLVNPYIEGSMRTKFKAGSSLEAAKLAYEELSQYFSNNVPRFLFSLKKTGSDSDNDFYHFQVLEKINNSDKLRYTIKAYNKANNIDKFKIAFKKTSKNLQGGGPGDIGDSGDISETDDKSDANTNSYKKDLVGGKYKKYKYDDDDDSSSSSSSSDSDYYYYYKPVNRVRPINYWSYYPYLYPTTRVYIPTFIPSITPYVNISIN